MAGSDRASYAIGFADLDQEVVVDRLPIQGEMPAWLSGALLRTGPAKYDLVPANRQSLVRRARHAAPVRICRRQRLLPQPLPAIELLPRGRRQRCARARRVCDRSLPHAVSARGRGLRADAAHRQLQRQHQPARRRGRRLHRDHAARPLRRRDAGDARRLWLRPCHRRQRIDRASPPRRPAQVPVQLRRRVRDEEPLPAVLHRRRRRRGVRGRRDAGRSPGLHAQLRHDRAVSRAGGVPAGRRSLAAQAAASRPSSATIAGGRSAACASTSSTRTAAAW